MRNAATMRSTSSSSLLKSRRREISKTCKWLRALAEACLLPLALLDLLEHLLVELDFVFIHSPGAPTEDADTILSACTLHLTLQEVFHFVLLLLPRHLLYLALLLL